MSILHGLQCIFQLAAFFAIDSLNNFRLPAQNTYQVFIETGPDEGFLANRTDVIGSWRVGPFIVIFFFLSSLFHAIAISPFYWDRYIGEVNEGRNSLRWFEYALSSTFMIIPIAAFFGVYNVIILFLIFITNSTMNLMGWQMELLNKYTKTTDWSPFIIGCILGSAGWIVIFSSFLSGTDKAYSEIPSFVYVVLIGYFVLFNCFPVLMFLQYKKVGRFKDYRRVEVGYQVLSLVAKSLLGWTVFGGLNQPSQFD